MNTLNFREKMRKKRPVNMIEIVFYASSIANGTKTLDDIPKRYRQIVEERLNRAEDNKAVEVNADVENDN